MIRVRTSVKVKNSCVWKHDLFISEHFREPPILLVRRLFISGEGRRYKRMNSLLDAGFMDSIVKNILTAPKTFALSVSMCLGGDKECNDDAEVRPRREIALTVPVSLE